MTRTNQDLKIGGTRTAEEAKEILVRAGVDAPLDEYHFVPLSDAQFKRLFVDLQGRDANAFYGTVPPGARQVSFAQNIQSGGKIPVFVRQRVFDSDEAIVQILSHEVYEIEALRYLARAPISVRQYNQLVGDGISGNLHYEAVIEGDRLLSAYRKLVGLN